MLFKVWNKTLIKDKEKTYLTSALSAGSTTLTVQSTDLAPNAGSSDTWSNNDYMIFTGKAREIVRELLKKNQN